MASGSNAKKILETDETPHLSDETTFYRLEPADTGVVDIAIPCLVLMSGSEAESGRQWQLRDGSLTLGRSQTANIQVNEISLSKLHARIDIGEGQVTITDLGSTNRTVLNDEILLPNEAYPLKNNDRIKAGSLIFKFLERGILSETSEKARMQTELETMKIIQESFLPSQKKARYGWVHIDGIYRPASESGGDWWWHWECAGRVFAIIGDTTGHGAGSALITSAARAAVASIEDDPNVDLDLIYTRLTHVIRKVTGGQLTMSAFLIEIDLSTRALRYINASHVPALMLNKTKLPTNWRELEHYFKPLSPALGSTDLRFFFGETIAAASTRLVMMTDGLTERLNAEGELLSERAFQKMLIEAHVAHLGEPTAFARAVVQTSDDWATTKPMTDDITLVVTDFS